MQFRSLSAAAVVGLLAAAAPAHAVIVYSGPVSIAVPDNIDGIYLNVVTGVSGITAVAGYDINPYSAIAGQFNLWGPTTTTWLSPSGLAAGPYPLTAGTSIGAAGTYTRPGGATNVGTQVTLNGANLLGFRFTNEATATTNFGWVEVTFGATAGARTITAYAYENGGGAILAGAVPEPAAVAMWLLGLATVGGVTLRRRQQQRDAA